METFISLAHELHGRYGLFTALALAAALCLGRLALLRFGNSAGGLFRHWTHRKLIIVDKKRLLGHQLFHKLRLYAEARIPAIHCQCALRKRLFGDLMVLRLSLYRETLEAFIRETDFHVTPAAFQTEAAAMLSGFFRAWERKAEEEGLPPVVVARFTAAIADLRAALLLVAQSLVSDYVTGDSNYASMNRLLDVICGLEEVIIVRLERTLDSMNGEISGLAYKGVICAHCAKCQSTHRPAPAKAK